ncbi:MAG: sugar porter family MFS transporter [Reichenbachiella sp.]
MKLRNQYFWSFAVAVSGFLFGFDTVVISGANLPIKELWNTSPLFHGAFIMSIALWGTVVGSLFGGIPCQRFGRKNTLLWVGILYFVSAIGSALATDPYLFSFSRFIGGLGVGLSTVASPMYISEISTPKNRGKLVALYQFNIVFGILIAFLSNYLLDGIGGANDWRWMLGVEAAPAFVYIVLIYFVPKSPRWLLSVKKDEEGARKVLELTGVDDVEKEIGLIKSSNQNHKPSESLYKDYRKPMFLVFFLAFFNQMSGINFVLYYAPEILEMTGLASKESLFNSIAIGGVNLIFTLLGLYMIDRFGRKFLLLIGSVGYIFSLTLLSVCFLFEFSPSWILIMITLFIASHAIGQGAVIWVFIAEIFPNSVRSYGQSFGTGTHWVFAAIITLVGPIMINLFEANPWPIFMFFSGMMVLQLIFVIIYFPETKGKSLEEIETIFNK